MGGWVEVAAPVHNLGGGGPREQVGIKVQVPGPRPTIYSVQITAHKLQDGTGYNTETVNFQAMGPPLKMVSPRNTRVSPDFKGPKSGEKMWMSQLC